MPDSSSHLTSDCYNCFYALLKKDSRPHVNQNDIVVGFFLILVLVLAKSVDVR